MAGRGVAPRPCGAVGPAAGCLLRRRRRPDHPGGLVRRGTGHWRWAGRPGRAGRGGGAGDLAARRGVVLPQCARRATQPGNPYVVMLMGALDLIFGQVRLAHQGHGSPVPAYGAPLVPGRAEPYRLERSTRDPDRGEQVTLAAADDGVAASRISPAAGDDRPNDRENDSCDRYQQRCARPADYLPPATSGLADGSALILTIRVRLRQPSTGQRHHAGGYRVPCDPRAVTVCHETAAPGQASQVSGGRHSVILLQGPSSSPGSHAAAQVRAP